MSKIRLLSRLDIKGPNLIKGVRFEGLRVLGDPEKFAINYYEQGIDELIYIEMLHYDLLVCTFTTTLDVTFLIVVM